MCLLLFQTYSLITGKSFSDFDFNIGKLWQTEEAMPSRTTSNSVLSLKEKVLMSNLDDQPSSVIERLKKLLVVELPSKKASMPQESTVEVQVQSAYVSELFDLTFKNNININSLPQNKQLQKYYTKLESDYLINPNMTPKQGKWYLGISFTPTLNYRTFSYDAAQVNGVAVEGGYRYTYGLTESSRNQTDKPITSYAIGIDVGRIISEKISFFSGLHYANYGEQIIVKAVDTENPNYERAQFMGKVPLYERLDADNKENNIPYTNNYSFFEIPLGVNFTVKSYNKSKMTADLGVNLQKMDHVNALVYDFESDYYYWLNSKEEIFSKFGVGTQVGVTLSQYVGERLELFINPQFKYTLNSTLKKPSPISQNQYSTGLRIGFKQQLF